MMRKRIASDRLVLTGRRRMKVGLLATRGVSSLEVDEDGTSGGSQQWRTRGGGDLMTFTSRVWPFQERMPGSRDCRGRSFFFLWLCVIEV